jgi:hypothetical protein
MCGPGAGDELVDERVDERVVVAFHGALGGGGGERRAGSGGGRKLFGLCCGARELS